MTNETLTNEHKAAVLKIEEMASKIICEMNQDFRFCVEADEASIASAASSVKNLFSETGEIKANYATGNEASILAASFLRRAEKALGNIKSFEGM